uniref:Uncharacterized protein n=1 Tax=viral metagenome TaxID=1070528 RepID=A0A6C0I4T3_9ZZZZ
MILIRRASIVAQDVIAKNADDVMNVENARRRGPVKNADQRKRRVARSKLALDKT